MNFRRIRFRLRSLLAATLIVSALLAAQQSACFQQYQAVRRVEALGGRVTYSHELSGELSPWMPAMFGQVESVTLGGWYIAPSGEEFADITTSATDRDLARIVLALPSLRRLFLVGTSVTDDSVDSLKLLSQANVICLEGTKVTEAGRRRLASHLPHCRVKFRQLEAMEIQVDSRDPLENYYLDLIAE
ncbi:hypothetical protein OAS39_04535 [Pirellulales bacterium]|nr:hypothetical protein [Pirellulales bacterium]